MQKYSIYSWLKGLKRSPGPANFEVYDVSECSSRNDFTLGLLRDFLEKFLFHPKVLEDLQAQLGETARLALKASVPTTYSLRAGVFGEALASETCERWHAYLVPLRRL